MMIPPALAMNAVAASGGYLMAAVADKIVAAPFAFLGSIGVVSQMINIHKVCYSSRNLCVLSICD